MDNKYRIEAPMVAPMPIKKIELRVNI